MSRGLAPGPAALTEDPLVVDLSQLPFSLVEREIGGRGDRCGRRCRRDVDSLSGHVAMGFEAISVDRETDLDFGDLSSGDSFGENADAGLELELIAGRREARRIRSLDDIRLAEF